MVMVCYVAPRVTSCHITLSPLKLNLAWELGEVRTERDLDTLLSLSSYNTYYLHLPTLPFHIISDFCENMRALDQEKLQLVCGDQI